MNDQDFYLWQLEAEEVLNKYETEHLVLGQIKEILGQKICIESVPLIKCNSYFDVIGVIGCLKNHFNKRNVQVLYRGQRNHYDFIQQPSFVRSFLSTFKQTDEGLIVSFRRYNEALVSYVSEFYKSISNRNKEEEKLEFETMNYLAWEPILAHYGFNTRYIDLVDDIPIAIWFSVFDLKTKSYKTDSKDGDEFGYLFLFGIDTDKKRTEGIWDGNIQRLVNLREAFPPFALRPHVQHAYLLADNRLLDEAHPALVFEKFINIINYNKFLFAVLKYKKTEALTWLFGKGQIPPNHLQFDTMFPSPQFDLLFKKLIEDPYKSPLLYAKDLSKVNNEWMKKQINRYWKVLGMIETYDYAFHDRKIK